MEQNAKYMATGRRKEAVAQVSIVLGAGKISVNKKPAEKYFALEKYILVLKQPFEVTNNINKFDVAAKVCGGGIAGQAEAMRLGIARALCLFDQNFKTALRQEGFLTRDPRAKERKKYGQKGARKRFQWTKR